MVAIAKKLKNAFSGLKLRLQTPTGMVTSTCGFCGSTNVEVERGTWLPLPYELPASAEPLADQMHRRDNGKCLACGLEQSFYHFSDAGRKLFYDLGLDVLSSTPEFAKYPPTEAWKKHIFERFGYPQRMAKWEAWFKARGIAKLERILHLRCQYGETLRRLHEQYHAEVWGAEVVNTCEQYVREKMPFIHQPEGSFAAQIELKFPPGTTFDFIICFHTLTHSQVIGRDLAALQALLAPGGVIVFCDEISKKKHNPFHMLHVDETTFTTMLKKYFPVVERLDDCGHPDKNITPYTLKGDNPDIIARKEAT